MGIRIRVPRLSAGLSYAAATLVVVAAAGGALAAVRHERSRAEVAAGCERLLAGDTVQARALLAGHDGDPRARAAAAVARAVDGQATDGPVDGGALDVRTVAQRTLAAGRYAATRRVAALVPTDPALQVLDAAAAIELGDVAGARAALSRGAPGWGPGREVEAVVALREAGAVTVVRDRRGLRAGTLDQSGALRLDPGAADLVPLCAGEPLRALGAPAGARLAIDLQLSRRARETLGDLRGTIVLLDARSGDVLVAVSDGRTLAEGGTPAWEQRREPASISKIVTTTATLRAGRDVDAEIRGMRCDRFARYSGQALWCSHALGPISGGLAQALASSCNVAFANLGVSLGWAPVLDELRRWGFVSNPQRTDAPWAGHIVISSGDDRQLASLSVGLDATDITPLHAALLGSVVRDGTMPEPAVVIARDGVLGLAPQPLPRPPSRRVIEAAWLPLLRRAMEAVTDQGGTAAWVDPPDFPVAMKTGTAAADGVGYHVNYIGAGPLPDPRIAFCVRITHQPTSGHVGHAARGVLARLLAVLAASGA